MTAEFSTLNGTSGWRYPHWRGVLYPPEMDQSEWIGHYAQEFSTVEVNSSLFGPLEESIIQQWCATTPEEFRFSVKAPRRLSYDKKLRNCESDLEMFLAACRPFGNRLGPIVFQLPNGWRANLRRLEQFLQLLPKEFRFVFDFRDPTWHYPEVFELLRNYEASYCIYQQHGFSTPMEATGDTVYVRLHGPDGGTVGSYQGATLRSWVSRALGWNRQGKQVLVYFDNDVAGFAVKNARRFKTFIREGAKLPGRT